MAVEVPPPVFAGLKGRNEAQFLEVVLVGTGRLLCRLIREFVPAKHAWQGEGSWRWWQEEGAVFDGAVAVLLTFWARAVCASAPTSLASSREVLTFALHLVLSHHFHVVPLHHLEEIWREVGEIGHLAERAPLQARWVIWVALVKVLQMACALLLSGLLLSLLLSSS